MTGRRLLLAGRIAGDPFPLPGSELLTLAVGEGSRSRLWAAFRDQGQSMNRQLVNGDAIAIVGTVDSDRMSPNGLLGPVSVEAVLGVDVDGGIFGGFNP